MSHAPLERIVREHSGRLLAYLASRTNAPAEAEDALSDAIAKALDRWPTDGVPDHPEAWLLRTARNRMIDAARRDARLVWDEALLENARAQPEVNDEFPDERLKLLFVCAHPAIAPADRTPLMLNLVLGLTAAQIAAAYAVAPSAMGARLVRAKAKIRIARIPFLVPDREVWAGRLTDVRDAIYASCGRAGLDDQAVDLASVLAGLVPDDGETLGLLSLLLFVRARGAASRDDGGRYVPSEEQAPSQWDLTTLFGAERALGRAAQAGAPGRYGIEAALQSAEVTGRMTGADTRAARCELYDALLRVAPSLGAQVAQAALVAEVESPIEGLRLLDALGAPDYQPYWATRAHLLAQADQRREADEAYGRAIVSAPDEATGDFLRLRREALRNT